VYENDIACILQGQIIQILDVSVSASPSLLKEIYMEERIYSMELSNSLLYLGTYSGLIIIDISNPIAPERLSFFPTSDFIRCLAVNDTLVYLGIDDDHIEVVDVSDSSNPTSLSNYSLISSQYAWDIDVQDDIIAIANGGGYLRFLNGSNPLALVSITQYSGLGTVYSVELDNNIAYAGPSSAGLASIDITDLGSISILDSNVGDGTAYHILCTDDLAIASIGGHGIFIVDTSDPENMTELFQGFGYNGRYVINTAIKDTILYIPDGRNGLYCLNIMTPDTPVIDGFFPGETGVSSMAILGDYAYFGHHTNGLSVIDMYDPNGPKKIGYWGTYSTSTYAQSMDSYNMAEIEVYGNLVFAADGERDLKIFNVSEPTNPTLIKSVELQGGYATGLAVGGHYAYISDRYYGVRVVDIQDPYHPKLEGGFTIETYYFSDVAYYDEVAYLIDGFSTLYVIDVSNATNPTSLCNYTIGGGARSVEVVDDMAFITNTNGLEIFNVSNPSSPDLISTYDDVPSITDAKILGNLACVSFSNGVNIINITDPNSPTTLARYNTTTQMTRIAYANGVFAAISSGETVDFYTEDLDLDGIQSDTYFDENAEDPSLNAQSDISFMDNESVSSIIWTPSDDNPAWYEIFLDNTLIMCGKWNQTGEVISFNPNTLTAGIHEVEIVVWDDGGLSDNDDVVITVIASSDTTTTTSTTTTSTTSTTTDTSSTSTGTDTSPTTTPGTLPGIFDISMIITIASIGVILVFVILIAKSRK